jgi:signal transduction histidine kinase
VPLDDGVPDEPAGAHREDPGREITRRILEAGDAARRRVAGDLHDGAQQKFVTTVINLQLAQAKFSSDPQRAKRHLDAALVQAQLGLGELHDLVTGIHPPILSHLGLRAALGSLTDGLSMQVELEVTEVRLPRLVEDSVYFFVSEGLTNVIKHAEADRVAIRVAAANGLLSVEVSDDGRGGATLTSRGTGLVGLQDRVEALRGELTIVSPAAGGTLLRAVLPLRGAVLDSGH